jgi:hypothetical protein
MSDELKYWEVLSKRHKRRDVFAGDTKRALERLAYWQQIMPGQECRLAEISRETYDQLTGATWHPGYSYGRRKD